MTGQFPGGEPGMPIHYTISTALVVEDEALVRMLGLDILEEAGFHVLEASNADEALAILGCGSEVHLLFSDINMPGSMDGLELAAIVKHRWPRVRLLVTSGHRDMQSVQLPETAKFIRKPWTSAALINCVREFVNS